MQLDQTRIVIRERGFGELLGLALQVMRAHAGGLTIAFLIGVLPFALLNGWLLWEILQQELWFEGPANYWFLLAFLVVLEVPFATAPITLYLGRITFSGSVSFRAVASDLLRSLPQLLFAQGFIRTLLMPFLLLPYLVRPYMGELVLLERNPFFAGKQKRLTTQRRSRNLHSSNGGELFSRWLLAIASGAVLWLALAVGAQSLVGQLAGLEPSRFYLHLLVYPAALWLVVGWMAVVRFLSYLDLRIRREGWEVELMMRAEAQQLQRTAARISG